MNRKRSRRQFTFDAATHLYRVDGDKVPSVTGKIDAAGLHDGSEWYTEESRVRGSRVHRASLELDLTGEHREEQYAGYLESYIAWKELMRPRWTTLEEPRFSEQLWLAGTADRLGFIAGRPVLVDLKTGSKEAWHAVQLALYDLIYDELPPRVRRRMALYLKADGRLAQHIEFNDPTDYDRALLIAAA